MFKGILAFLLLITLGGSLFVFQSCGPGAFESKKDRSSAHLHIGESPVDTFKTSVPSQVQPLYANRVLLYNIYRDIFGASVQSALVERVGWASTEMGSAFGLYEKVVLANQDCRNKRSPFYLCTNSNLDLATPPVVGASAPREGRRIRACQLAVDNKKALAHAFNRIEKNANLANPPAQTDANFKRIFQLFFRGKPLPDQGFFDQLKITLNGAADAEQGWKSVIHSICLSPHWQVL